MMRTCSMVAFVIVLSAATRGPAGAESAQGGGKNTARPQSSIACEYACQLDLGPCKRNSPDGAQGCDERYRRCVEQCNK